MKNIIEYLENIFSKVSIKYVSWIFVSGFSVAFLVSILLSKIFFNQQKQIKLRTYSSGIDNYVKKIEINYL